MKKYISSPIEAASELSETRATHTSGALPQADEGARQRREANCPGKK